jgi:hypothetical protein
VAVSFRTLLLVMQGVLLLLVMPVAVSFRTLLLVMPVAVSFRTLLLVMPVVREVCSRTPMKAPGSAVAR